MYEYHAEVLRVVDGDTVDVLIDVGFSTFKKERVRLHGINTPECRTRDLEEKKKGLAAKDRLETLIGACDNKCIIKTELDKKVMKDITEQYFVNTNKIQELLKFNKNAMIKNPVEDE